MKGINKRITLFAVTITSFLTPFMGSSINVALPSIGREFSMNAILLSWIPTAYLLSAAMFLVPFGKLGDIHGRRKIFLCGTILYTLSSFLSGIAKSAYMLIFFRVLQGIGGAMIFGIGVAILTSVFPQGERGKALGINSASVYLGLSFGPLLGGFLTHHLGWRSIFFANVLLGLIVIVLLLWKLKGEWIGAKEENFDFFGSFLYSLSLVTIMYGFSSLKSSASGLLLVFTGILILSLFFAWERKVKNPLIDINLFIKNRVFTFSNLAAFINYSSTSAVGFLLSLYLQYIKAFNPQNAGLILTAQPVVMAIFSPFAGRLSDRMEPGVIASAGMGLTALSLLLFASINIKTALKFIIGGLILLGFGLALFSSPNTNAVMSSIEKRFYGVASATLATMRLTGQMFSMGVVMLVFAIYLGKIQIKPESHLPFVTSIRLIFIIFTLLSFFGIFASLKRGKVKG